MPYVARIMETGYTVEADRYFTSKFRKKNKKKVINKMEGER